MKSVYTIAILMTMIGSGVAEDNNTTLADIYMAGIYDGYELGVLYMQGQTNETAENEYNSETSRINALLDEANHTPEERLGPLLKLPEYYELPKAFR